MSISVSGLVAKAATAAITPSVPKPSATRLQTLPLEDAADVASWLDATKRVCSASRIA